MQLHQQRARSGAPRPAGRAPGPGARAHRGLRRAPLACRAGAAPAAAAGAARPQQAGAVDALLQHLLVRRDAADGCG